MPFGVESSGTRSGSMNVELPMMRMGIVLLMLILGACGSSSTTPTFTGERTVDTTTAPAEKEGYTASLGAVDWLLLSQDGHRLEVLASGSGCSRFNGYRVRQTPQEVELEVVNTVLTTNGLPHACPANLSFTNQVVELPEPLSGAKVSGGCSAAPVAGEGRTCNNLRSVAKGLR